MNAQTVDLNGSNQIKPTVISTFAGCGGSSLGYHLAGFKELLAVEWDDNAVATFKLNFPSVPIYHGDIAKLSSDECMRLAGIKKGELDVFDGSPPCQGFSTAGKRKMTDPRNSLFKEYARLINDLQPKAFVMENVTGMVKGHMKQAYLQIIQTLRDCGYSAKGQVMNAMYYNVPQSRERVIIIGVRNDLGVAPSHPKPQSKPKGIIFAPQTRQAEQKLSAHEINTAIAHKKRHEAKGNGFGYVCITESKPCCTFPKTLMRSSSAPRIVINEKEHWLPSPVELCRIASFPDDFKFINYESQWERIGNSVPPNLMKAIALHIRENILAKI